MKKIFFVLVFLVLGVEESYSQTAYGNRGAASQISCLVTDTAIDSRDTLRVSFIVQNTDTTNPVFICLGTAACTTTTGIRLDPGTTTSKNALSTNPLEYVGALRCIATGGTVTVIYSEVLK